jgi:hypothetical protein
MWLVLTLAKIDDISNFQQLDSIRLHHIASDCIRRRIISKVLNKRSSHLSWGCCTYCLLSQCPRYCIGVRWLEYKFIKWKLLKWWSIFKIELLLNNFHKFFYALFNFILTIISKFNESVIRYVHNDLQNFNKRNIINDYFNKIN